MPEPHESKLLRLNEEHDNVFKLMFLGYDDFRITETCDFARIYNWTALHFVRNGKGYLFLNGRKYEITAGNFFVIPYKTPAVYYSDLDDPWRYYWLGIAEDTLFDLQRALGLSVRKPVCTSKAPERIARLFDCIFDDAKLPVETYYDALSILMKVLGAEYASNLSGQPPIGKNSLVENAKNIMNLNFARSDFRVGNISEMLYVSHQHLGRLFKKVTGQTLIEYLSEKRLLRAAELLEEEHYSVSQLAEKSGFENDEHFMRAFKKRFGMTVGQFRRNIERERSV